MWPLLQSVWRRERRKKQEGRSRPGRVEPEAPPARLRHAVRRVSASDAMRCCALQELVARRQRSHQRPIQRESVCETVMSVPALLASSACLPPASLLSSARIPLQRLVQGLVQYQRPRYWYHTERKSTDQSVASQLAPWGACYTPGGCNECVSAHPGCACTTPHCFRAAGFLEGGAARPGIYTPGSAGVGDPTSPRADVGTVG